MTEKFWLTPPELYQSLDEEFHFDFDPCPYPRPLDFNGILLPWGKSNYVNPPFRHADAAFAAGPTAFARKAIQEMELGKSSVLLLPTVSYVNILIAAGAECRSMGRLHWIEAETGKIWNNNNNITMFILHGKKAT
jgi:hypothetical protein